MRLALTTNEPRSRYLFDELRSTVDVVGEVDFDHIDIFTKYSAALLSIKFPRWEWWGNYQMHPLIQRRRRKVLRRGLDKLHGPTDALLMWGSWFHPYGKRGRDMLPFFNYIDQSRSLTPVLGEPATSSWGRQRSHALQAATYADSSGILCMSQWARAQTLEAHPHLPSSKVQVVGWGPCGVDLSAEDIDEAAREPMILHVSNNFERKGVDFLIATAREVARTRPDARFVVIGRDSSRMHLPEAQNIEFIGPVYDKERLAAYFRKASLFFLPHRFDRSPHVLAEAMSARLPIVTSEQGGPIEVTRGTGAGFCVPVGNIGGYTTAILDLLNLPELRKKVGAAGRQLMRKQYTWKAVTERTLSIIQCHIANTAATRGKP